MTTRSLILAAALAAPLPAAALTPEELWVSWQEMVAAFGGAVEATATPEADGALRLSGFRAGPAGGPLQPMRTEAPVQEVLLRPAADGTVAIDIGAIGSFDIPGTPTVRVDPRDATIVARDTGSGIVCDVAAARLSLAAMEFMDSPPMGEFAAELLSPVLSLPCGVRADGRYEVAAAVDGLAYLSSSPPDAFMASSQASRLEGPLSVTVGYTLPPIEMLQAIEEPQDFLAALDAGLGFDLTFENGRLEQTDWSEGFLAFESTMSTSPGRFEMSFDRTGLVMTGAYEEGGQGSFTAADLPVGTVEYGYGAMDMDIRVPFGPGPGELRYRVAIEDVTVGESLWSMVDPDGALPRDPARLVVDLGGTMAMDLSGLIAATEGPMATPPYPDIEVVEIRELDVSVAGVSLGGEGRFTFETLDGMPSPIGTATIRLAGLDRLLDTVAEMGWATPEDVRNMRLGLAAMFRAGDGPDTRVATIEAQAGGAILVNGVRMN